MPNLISARIPALAVAIVACAQADVTLPAVLADHMVIQRNRPVHVWGRAAAGESVAVTLRGQTRSTTADSIGSWGVYLPPMEAGGPFELTVKATNTIRLTDIMAGDVWVASGQSNMEFAVREVTNAATELAAANYPRIRLFHVKNKVAGHPLDNVAVDSSWQPCSPESVSGFSAVAYFFGRNLHQTLNVPIGLIETSWGGTPADAWTSLRALSADASLMPVFAEWARMSDNTVRHQRQREKQVNDWQQAVNRAKAEGKEPPGYPWEPNMENSWMPAGLFNAMIAPLTPSPIRGVIWYQGESNASRERAPLYRRLFGAMIQDWRRAWGQGDFPFLFVQLANFKTGPDTRWPELREAQRQTLALANTGMAVTIDIGDPSDIHPKNKQDVGTRLALAARAIEYGERIEYSGPLFRQATPEGSRIRLWFEHIGKGLSANGSIRGFEIAGADRKFVRADAVIDGATVVASSPSIPTPMYVRYAWSDNPDGNLYNADGLPASPFHSGE